MSKEKTLSLNGQNYKLTSPTLTQSSVADMEYSKAYTKALIEGLLPKQALERRLIAVGAWTQADEDYAVDLTDKMNNAFQRVLLAQNKEQKDEFLAQYLEFRQELVNKSQEKQALFTHTAEAKGDEAKYVELMWQCVLNEDGSRVWPDKNTFLSKNSNDVNQLLMEFIAFLTGLDDKIDSFDQIVNSSYETLEKELEEAAELAKTAAVEPITESEVVLEKKDETQEQDKPLGVETQPE